MKIRVMVVEDEPPIQRSICQKIEETNKNFTVVAAFDNGKDALQYLKEHPGTNVVEMDCVEGKKGEGKTWQE